MRWSHIFRKRFPLPISPGPMTATPVYEMLVALQKRLKPKKDVRRRELINKLIELRDNPKANQVEEGSDGEIQHAGFALRGVVNTTSTSTDYPLRVTGWRPMKPPAMPEERDMSARQDVRLGHVISRRAELDSSSQPASRALAAG